MTCADDPAVPHEQDIALVGAGSSARPDLEANLGFVSERVGTIFVWGGDELGMFAIRMLEGLRGWDVAPFFFVPSADAGRLEIWGGGSELGRVDVCFGEEVSGSCRTEVTRFVPLGPLPPKRIELAPGESPEVTYGGDWVPYVDHVMNVDGVVDPGVVGEKVVIAYGTVEGVPWSLTAFNVAGGDAPPEPSPSGELSIGSPGGGTGIGTLYPVVAGDARPRRWRLAFGTRSGGRPGRLWGGDRADVPP